MSSDRDTTRIVRSWLEDGSTALPDRVLDAVLSDLPSTPQRRPSWAPWRSPNMSTFLRLGAVAAVVVVAIVAGVALLPRGSDVGVPAPSASAPASPSASPTVEPSPSDTATVAGQIDFRPMPDTDATVVVDATASGTQLSGTAVLTSSGPSFTTELQCLRQLDETTWMLAGEIVEASDGAPEVGMPMGFIVRDATPQQALLWFGEAPTDCAEFVAATPTDLGPMIVVKSGEIALPPAAGS